MWAYDERNFINCMLHCQNIDLHIILGRSVLVCSSSANLRSSFGFYLSAIRQQKKISSKRSKYGR